MCISQGLQVHPLRSSVFLEQYRGQKLTGVSRHHLIEKTAQMLVRDIKIGQDNRSAAVAQVLISQNIRIYVNRS